MHLPDPAPPFPSHPEHTPTPTPRYVPVHELAQHDALRADLAEARRLLQAVRDCHVESGPGVHCTDHRAFACTIKRVLRFVTASETARS